MAEQREHDCLTAAEFREHRKEAKVAMAQIAEIVSWKPFVRKMQEDMSYLQKLSVLEDIKDQLIGPATGRMQVPLSVCLTICGFLGVALILVLVANTEKTIDIGWNHIRIESKADAH